MNNINLKILPAFKILILFLLGFAISFVINSLTYVLVFSLILLLLSIYFYFKSHITSSFLLGAILIGTLSFVSLDKHKEIKYNLLTSNQDALFEAILESKISESQFKEKFIAYGNIKSGSFRTLENVRFIFTHFKNDNVKLNKGQEIFANVKIIFPQKPSFKNEYDEYSFCLNNACNFIAVQDGSIAILENEKGIDKFVSNLTKKLNSIIDNYYDFVTAGIIKALILGDRSNIDKDTILDFSHTGTAHILSVSGMHITLIATIVYLLLAFINNKWLKFVLFSIVIIVFIFISGNQASAIRAGIMAILFLFIRNIQRQGNLINILSFTTLISVLFYPSLIFSVGFQLSILSMFGIAFTYNPIQNLISKVNPKEIKILDFLVTSISMSLSASIIVSILVAIYFNIYSIISIFANFFIIPLMTLGMLFSILTIFISLISNQLAILFANSTHILISCSLIINTYLSDLSFSFIKGNSAFLISLFAFLFLVYPFQSNNFRQFSFRFVSISIIFLLFYNLFENHKVFRILPRNNLTFVQLNINERDYILLLQRKKSQSFKKNDIEINKYLDGNPNSIYFVNSKKLKELLKNKITNNIFGLDLNNQKKLKLFLNLNEEIYQLTYNIEK